MSFLWPYELIYKVEYEAGMGMGERKFIDKDDENAKENAIEFAKKVGGTVYEVKRIWP